MGSAAIKSIRLWREEMLMRGTCRGRASAKLFAVGMLVLLFSSQEGNSAQDRTVVAKQPTLVALTIGSAEGDITIVVPEGGMATHRDLRRGLYLGFEPTIVDLDEGDVDIRVFALQDVPGASRRETEVGRISGKIGFRDILAAAPDLDVTVRAVGGNPQTISSFVGRRCAGSPKPPLTAAFGGGGCCVSCGGSTSCGCAVGGGCGSCCGGCCAW